ncbi:23S rRNA (guanosine(2251)-2'-O)-methyltransferase RlmB [Fonticella tunisiensis]|uniref:23S rRNA (Guanosine2251-2'-O)-methyltransferase n=1 Tax=Fonticella tunisiensis TaxID=1096341 RepID=A0A4R7KCU2_9CLOT|nr:23S rRNA (guanosine(2251)-2'-O)-methyltransferase RlmB [Fonticella tunisiensis]TDT51267.1 23S rRNA (guanosine2251-2'-O)-methyltransferase [Fonticella tunisiensis]
MKNQKDAGKKHASRVRRDRETEIDFEKDENIVEGRNPVIEAIKSGRTIEKLYVAKGDLEGSIKMIISMAKDRGIVISEVDRRKLDELSRGGIHQGVLAVVSPYQYSSMDDILSYAEEKGEDPFVIILDEIEDPHNLGSIVRTANICGAHGVIIPKRRSALVTAAVAKASAGAVEYTKIAKVTNITQTIKKLKDRGIWVMGADMDGSIVYESNMKGPIALVIGSEGRGISRLVRENCDMIVSVPVKGQINSLNASVAAGIIMYEVVRQRSSTR